VTCSNYHKTTGVPIISSEKRWNERLKTLKITIEKYMNIIPEKEITVEELFYDGYIE
jgi:hypothetical protein